MNTLHTIRRAAQRPFLVVVALLFFAALAPAIAAATPADAAEPPQSALPANITETLDVRLVNVEAVVTDRQGVRVPGLDAEDFRLVVDGEEVPIEFFTEIRGGMALEVTASRDAEVPVILPGEPLGTSYLVFIDDYFTLNTDRQTVLRNLIDDLAFLTPEDRMAIVAWDGSRADMLSSWTQSQRELNDALRLALERPAYGLQRISERGLVDRSLRSRFAAYRPGELTIDERMYVERLTDQLARGVRAATATLRSFAQPPGRKVMLLVSGGWPMSPADFVDGTPLGAFYERSFYADGESLYGSLVETANLLGYTLYPVDAPGLEEASFVDASRGFGSPARFADLNYYQELEIHSSLEYLARETGGKAMLNGQRTSALENAQADTRSFYWLGFTPKREGTDSKRDIQIEVVPEGLKVRGRSSYTDLSKETEVAMAVESALLFGHPASDSKLMMEFGAPKKAGRGKVEVPLVIHIPIDEITMLPVGEHDFVANLALRIAVVDERGQQSFVPNIPLELHRKELPGAGESVTYETSLKMRKRPHDLIVAVYDESSGDLLSASAELGI